MRQEKPILLIGTSGSMHAGTPLTCVGLENCIVATLSGLIKLVPNSNFNGLPTLYPCIVISCSVLVYVQR